MQLKKMNREELYVHVGKDLKNALLMKKSGTEQ